MPRGLTTLRLGPFMGGLNTRFDASLLKPDQAQVARDVNLFDGTLAGALDVGSSVAVNASYPSAKWIAFSGAGGSTWSATGSWLFDNAIRYHMKDGPYLYTTRSGAGPLIYDAGGNSFSLGIKPITGIGFSATIGGSTTYSFGITYQTFDGLESNIQAFDLNFTTTSITFNDGPLWPSDSRVSAVRLWAATIYGAVSTTLSNAITSAGSQAATPASMTNIVVGSTLTIDIGDLQETVTVTAVTASTFTATFTKTHLAGVGITASAAPGLYYLQQTLSSRGTTAFSAVTTPTTTGEVLTWGYGGYPANEVYTSDHSAAPVLTVIADRIHSVASGVASAGAGIVIGAVGNVLRWSMNGYPQYWPIVNSIALDYNIEAIIAYSGYSVIFTTGAIYLFSGNNDDAMSLQRLDTALFVTPGAGKSVVRTRRGTFYLAPEGICVFDGAASTVISDGDIAPSTLTNLDVTGAGYANGRYYLFHSTGYIVADLRDGKPRFSTSNTVINAASYEDFRAPVVGIPGRTIPTTASATAIGMRLFGFCSDNNSTLYLVGGNYLETTRTSPAPRGEESRSQAYALNTGSSSANWVSAGVLAGGEYRSSFQAVYVGGKVYCYGGRDWYPGGGSTYSTMQVLTPPSSWAIDSTTSTYPSGPGGLIQYAATADTTEVDTTGFWVHGGSDNAISIRAILFKYTISPASWTSISTSGPTLMNHGMVYVPGTVFSDSKPRLFIFGGENYSTYGTNVTYCYNLTDNTWSDDQNSEGTGISSAQGAGVGARSRHVYKYNAVSKKIFLHGGVASDLSSLSDLWEFDPRVWVDAGSGSRVAAWINTSGTVVNMDDRFWHGGAFLDNSGSNGERLYLAGGSSATSLFNSDLYDVFVQPLESQQTTSGIYVLKPNDGGNVRLLEGGSAQKAVWQTGSIRGDNPATYKHAQCLRADFVGDVNIGVFKDNNASPVSMVTLTSATRAQIERWLPISGASAATGKRLSFQFICANATMTGASSGVAGILYSAEIDISEEGDSR